MIKVGVEHHWEFCGVTFAQWEILLPLVEKASILQWKGQMIAWCLGFHRVIAYRKILIVMEPKGL